MIILADWESTGTVPGACPKAATATPNRRENLDDTVSPYRTKPVVDCLIPSFLLRNPGVTLTYFTLGKVGGTDSFFYAVSQFAGGIFGALVACQLFGSALRGVHYAVTAPGAPGPLVAFGAELSISAVMMFGTLTVSNRKHLHRYTPLFTGALAAAFLTFEAPLSGASMNPARTFGPAFSAQDWTSLWVYLTGPPLGMLLAAQGYRAWRGSHNVFCAKLHHENNERCIFKCNFASIR